MYNNHDEKRRLEALLSLEVLDTAKEIQFDELVELASMICGTPISAISLVDSNRQWFKAARGLGDTTETPRDQAFCAHAILAVDPFIIEDATEDSRFSSNPLVTGNPGVRFYAGIPLINNGEAIGALCVIDRVSRQLTDQQIAALKLLAKQVESQLQARLLSQSLIAKVRELELSREVISESERNLKLIIESSFDGVVIHDGSKFTYVSETAAQLFGCHADEILGQPPQKFIRPESTEILNSKLQSVSAENYRILGLKKDGSEILLNIRSKQINFGGLRSRIGFVQDFSERDRLAGELREMETRLDALTENIPGAVYRFTRTTDGVMKFQYLSSGTEEIYEVDRSVLLADFGNAASMVHPEDIFGFAGSVDESAQSGKRFRWTGRIIVPGGKIKWIEATSQPRTNKDLTVTWDGVIFDITEQKAAQAQIESQRAQVVAAAKMASLGEMAAGLAHEINNAINYVSGSLTGLERLLVKTDLREDSEKAKLYCTAIREGTRITVDIVRSLRGYSSSDVGGSERIALAEVSSAVLNILGSKLRSKSIGVVNHIHEHSVVVSNRGTLSQVLMNLVSNAADALAPGGQIIISSIEVESAIEIIVQDTGPGISPEVLGRIFEPFYTTKAVGEGTGLGLFIVQKEVERLGGSIRCDSILGTGTTFTVKLNQPHSTNFNQGDAA